jgi:hypothetical protein
MDLINSKLEKQKAERDAKLSRKPSVNVKALSEEEKARRLQEMQQDALASDALRMQRVTVPKDGGANEDVSAAPRSEGDPNFITEMRSEVYVSANATSLQDRLQQNKHYAQKSTSLNSEGFTKK